VLGRSTAGRLRHLVQLHLSRDCNRPGLARAAVQAVLDELGLSVTLHTAEQHTPGPTLHLNAAAPPARRPRTPRARPARSRSAHPRLPGFDHSTGPDR
jgi:hypothetical protein